MFAATVRCGNSRPSWKTSPTRRRSGEARRDVGAADQHGAGGGRPHAGDRLEHQALAGAARSEQHDVAAVAHLEVDRPGREAAGRRRQSAQLDHGAPVLERRRLGTRNVRTSRNTTNATITMSTAGGCAALQPEALEALEGEHRDDLGVVGEDHDGAELADAAPPHEDGSGEHAPPGLRERHAREGAEARGSERARDVLIALVHQRERLARAVDEERQAHEHHGEHDAGHRLRELDAERRQQPPDDALPAVDGQEGDAGGRVREDDRQVDDAFDRPLAGEVPAGEQVRQRHAEDEADGGGDERRRRR